MNTKQEFTDGLRRALTGKISHEEVEEYVRYYDDYITAESRKQGDEKAVLDGLGSPSLIAMSICAADDAEDKKKSSEGMYGTSENYYYGNERDSGTGGTESAGKDTRPFVFRHPKLTIVLIIIGLVLLLVLFIALAFSLLKILWPAIVSITLILLVVRLIVYLRDNMM